MTSFWVALTVLHIVIALGMCAAVCDYLGVRVGVLRGIDRFLPSAVRCTQAPPETGVEVVVRCGVGLGVGLCVWAITAVPAIGGAVAIIAVGLELAQIFRPLERA